MNVIEKIMAAHSDEDVVCAGDMIDVNLAYVMANDATTTLAIDVFKDELKQSKVFDSEKVVIIMDHYTPCSSISAGDTHNKMREFCREQDIKHVYDGAGVCHQLMLEKYAKPGDVIIGADSHTCTYGAIGMLSTGMGSTDIAVAWMDGKIWMRVPEAIKIVVNGSWPEGVYSKDLILKIIGDISTKGATYKAIVFEGEAIDALSISGRATLCNMGIEAGAKFAYIQPDSKVASFLEEMGRGDDYTIYHDDEDAIYEKVLTYDVSMLTPQIAAPHSVDNVYDITKFEGMKIDELFIGACTNGRFDDLEIAANILKGKKIADNVRLIVTPASRDIYLKASRNGLLDIFMESGAMISNPGCSACFGGTGGLLGKDDVLLTTANRNYKGRVGSPEGKIYLASPAVVATSAITGVVTRPTTGGKNS